MFSFLTSYKYSPLKPATEPDGEFRLLTILPSATGGKIKCTLQHALIAAPPRYEALSYTWGDPKGPGCYAQAKGDPTRLYNITVNGKRAKVSYNLNGALQQIRHQTIPRVVWVDAICINQSDNSEKNHQVQSMVKMYSQASQVLVWLGEDDKYVDLAFDTIEHLCWTIKVRVWQYCCEKLNMPLHKLSDDIVASFMESERNIRSESYESPFTHNLDVQSLREALSTIAIDFYTVADPVRLAIENFGRDSLPVYMLSDHGELSDYPGLPERVNALDQVFLFRNYWSRLWVLQELMAAREAVVLCGKRQMNMRMAHCLSLALGTVDSVSGGSHLLKNCDSSATIELRTCSIHLVELIDSRMGEPTLFTLWASNRGRLCSEPRDYIYALLSIAQPVGIKVDYGRPEVEVFVDATRSIIAQAQNLNILCRQMNGPLVNEIRYREHMISGLPSWVPNYACRQDNWPLINAYLHLSKQRYRGGGLMPIETSSTDVLEHMSLVIYGYFCGEVVGTAPRIPIDLDVDRIWETVMQLRKSFPLVTENKEVTTALDEVEFWRVMVGDIYYNSGHDRERIEWSAEARANLLNDIEIANVSAMPARMVETVRWTLQGATFCETATGSMGVVQGNVQVGDKIFVARGATLPLILREVENDGTFEEVRNAHTVSTLYKFIGPSYIHGSMDGQIIEEMEAKGIADETVVLL